MSDFSTPRFALCATGLILATALCAFGKLAGDAWVYAFGLAIAGHAEEVVRAIRGGGPRAGGGGAQP